MVGREITALIPGARSAVWQSVGIGSLVTAALLGQGVLLALLVNHVMHARFDAALGCGAALVALALARAGLTWRGEVQAERSAYGVRLALRRAAFSRLMQLGPAHLSDARTGEVQTSLVGGVAAVEAYVGRFIPAVWVALIGPFLAVGLFLAIDPLLGVVLLGAVVLAPAVNAAWLAWRMPRSAWIFKAISGFTAHLIDGLQGIATLKAFNASSRWRDELGRRAADLRRASMRSLAISLMRDGVTTLASLGAVSALVVWSAWRVQAGDLDPLVLLIVLFTAREAFGPVERLEKAFHAGFAGATASKAMVAFLAGDERCLGRGDAPAPPPQRFDIAFEDVTFRYPGSERNAVEAASFSVAQGEVVALVGPSGAGKSTMTSLLLGFLEPQAGAIRIGGRDIRELSPGALRGLISLVAQDTFLFSGSIADNLRLAKPDAPDDELIAAAQAANAHDFISTLPEGYQTQVGERGARLSGGQRQRIAIARAILKDAPILLLDEPTSSLDSASEKLVRDALTRVMAGRTSLVVAHQLSTIQRADRILVFDGGKIIQSGRHETLAAGRGLYSRLLQAQGVQS